MSYGDLFFGGITFKILLNTRLPKLYILVMKVIGLYSSLLKKEVNYFLPLLGGGWRGF
jgi:hypothetical protein